MKSLGQINCETYYSEGEGDEWECTSYKSQWESAAQAVKSAVLAQNATAIASEASKGVQIADTAEIKPCPFCGGEVKIDDYGFSTPDEKLWEPYWMCGCIKCGICMPNTQESQNKQEAINAWNKRA